MNSILLLRPDKAGDLIKTLPVLRALVAASSDASIHVIASKANESLLKHEPNIRYSSLPSGWENLSDTELSNTLRESLSGFSFQTAINLLTDSFPQAERLLNVAPATEKFSIFSPNLPFGIWPVTFKQGSPIHRNETLNIAEIVGQALGLDLLDSSLRASRAPHIGQEDRKECFELLKQKSGTWVGICPLAGTQQRTHPLKAWEKLLDKICNLNHFEKVLVFGAPSDLKTLEQMKASLKSPHLITLICPSSFRTLGAFLSQCDRIIAVDSGPLHYSLALGIPSLGFLSGGDHQRWFSQISPQDKLVPRGIFSRFPSSFEMCWHLRNWL